MADKVKDPADKGMIRVLVYGTLKKGHSNHVLLEQSDAQFIGYDSVTGPYQLWDLGAIPAVMDEPNNDAHIRGELWALGPEGLASLDMLEGHPDFYQRRKLVTDVHERRAWMYFLNSDGWLGARAEKRGGGMWHASKDEVKFWMTRENAA